MPFTIIRQDITKMKVDAIVNAANIDLQMGGGVCGVIFNAAGASELKVACDKLSPIKTGKAVITDGFKLPAKYIIHTAGPVYRDGKSGEGKLLQSCYLRSLELAVQHKCKSIAFPLISSGIYGYPKREALQIATAAIQEFLQNNDIEIYLAVFDKSIFAVSEQLIGAVDSYIDERYIDEHLPKHQERNLLNVNKKALFQVEIFEDVLMIEKCKPMLAPQCLDSLIGKLDEGFSETLLRLIDAKGKTDVEVYKRANLDRRLFSKIRTGKGYMPSKRTAVALAVALELSIDETDDLLERAGFTLSRSQKFDVIIEYFISNGKYNIFEINEVLFYYDQPILGG